MENKFHYKSIFSAISYTKLLPVQVLPDTATLAV